MKIIVLGAGAIGSVYGARLSKFHDVTVIGGTSHVDAIQRDGLSMQGCTTGNFRLPAHTRVPSIESGTLILLTTKVNNNIAAVEPIVDMLPAAVNVLGTGALTVISAVASVPPKRARSRVLPTLTAITVMAVPFCETVATFGESVVQTTGADTTSLVLVRTVAVTGTDRGSPGGAVRFMEAGDS